MKLNRKLIDIENMEPVVVETFIIDHHYKHGLIFQMGDSGRLDFINNKYPGDSSGDSLSSLLTAFSKELKRSIRLIKSGKPVSFTKVMGDGDPIIITTNITESSVRVFLYGPHLHFRIFADNDFKRDFSDDLLHVLTCFTVGTKAEKVVELFTAMVNEIKSHREELALCGLPENYKEG